MASTDPRGLIPYIRSTATKYGINPDVAVKVAQSEGLGNFTSGIPGENSFGAFQLNTQGGLGNDFQKATGLDPSDPANEQAGIDYALKYASQNGWTAFHGAKNRYGFGQWEGINSPYASVNAAPLTPGSQAPALPPGVNIDGQQPQPTQTAGGVLPATATQQQQKQAQGVLAYAAPQQQAQQPSLLANLMAQANQASPRPQINLAQLQQLAQMRSPLLGWNGQGWNGNGWT